MNSTQAIRLLKSRFDDKRSFRAVLSHSLAVQKAALKIAKKIKANNGKIDLHFIKIASLLHDIGRAKHKPTEPTSIKHGIEGARVLRNRAKDFPSEADFLKKAALVCERHLGAGITKNEIIKNKLPLPKKDLIPVSIEEKVICFSDKLVQYSRIRLFNEIIQRYESELGKPVANKLRKLKKELESLMGEKIV